MGRTAFVLDGLDRVAQVLADDLRRVEERLVERTVSTYEFVDLAVQHVIESGGKRLRPILVMLSAKALGSTDDKMVDYAAAMEMIHVASLVHDDVIDEAKLRRNHQTLNAKFGNKVAVLVGDYMHARVLAILVARRAPNAIYRAVAQATQGMCEGEVIAAYKSNDFEIETNDYNRIIELKTARLITSCCEIGALVETQDEEVVEAFSTYGHGVGMAFQIVDDVLDLIGEETTFGKPTRNDLREGKLTLPVMVARDRCSPDERKRLEHLFLIEERSANDIEWIVNLTHRYDGVSSAMETARNYVRDAKWALEDVYPSAAKDAMFELAEFFVSRDY